MQDPRFPAFTQTGDTRDELNAFRMRLMQALDTVVEVKTTSLTPNTDAAVAGKPVNTSDDGTFFLGDATIAPFAAHLPDTGLIPHHCYWFKKADGSANAITITPKPPQTIDGATSFVLDCAGEVLAIVSDGAHWQIADHYDPCAELAAAARAVTQASANAGTVEAIGVTFDNGGLVLVAGRRTDVWVPFACTVTGVTILATEFTTGSSSGSVVVDVRTSTYAEFPPQSEHSITAAARPTLTASHASYDDTLTGWHTSIDAGECVRFVIDSVSAIRKFTITLRVMRR